LTFCGVHRCSYFVFEIGQALRIELGRALTMTNAY